MPRTPRLVLTGVALTLFAAMGWSAPRFGQQESGLSRIWAVNLGSETAEVRVERSQGGISHQETLVAKPGEAVEVQRSASETVRVTELRDLLLVTASPDFDPAALSISPAPGPLERPAAGTHERRGDSPAGTAAKASEGTRLQRGNVISSTAFWIGAEPRTFRLGLRGPKSWAEVRIKRPDGAVLGYVTLGASRAVDVTIDFGRLPDASRYAGVVNQEIVARTGQVIALTRTAPRGTDGGSGRLQRVTAAVTRGDGHFNYNINWRRTPPLYYYVEGGPPNTCGEANVKRNGEWHFTPNWLCTDGNGNATKGPWYWENQPDDENAEAFIRWPDFSATTTDWHIWDKRCPSISIDCAGSPPTCWQGFASDPPFGACFNPAWSKISSSFARVDPTTGAPLDFWSPSTRTYGHPPNPVGGTLFGIPSCSANWASDFPDRSAHTAGQAYRWSVCVEEKVDEGGCTACFQHGFIAN
ncbi:MAG TPA: hypothetical protein VE685_24965 [Thermoanaerobaculia bacterium]|nr:hypothetical protein [Thermoanaerobaculia bacterium]